MSMHVAVVRRRIRLIHVILLLLLVCMAAAWLFVVHVRSTDLQLWQLHEAARAMDVYMRLEGRWPSSLEDLERTGIVCVGDDRSFTVTSRDYDCLFPGGPYGLRVDGERVRLGWSGVAVDERGTLIAMCPPGCRIVEERARLLSDRLRETAAKNVTNDAERP